VKAAPDPKVDAHASIDLQHGLGRPFIIEIGPSVDWGRLLFRLAASPQL
jgi:hypothetical protein